MRFFFFLFTIITFTLCDTVLNCHDLTQDTCDGANSQYGYYCKWDNGQCIVNIDNERPNCYSIQTSDCESVPNCGLDGNYCKVISCTNIDQKKNTCEGMQTVGGYQCKVKHYRCIADYKDCSVLTKDDCKATKKNVLGIMAVLAIITQQLL